MASPRASSTIARDALYRRRSTGLPCRGFWTCSGRLVCSNYPSSSLQGPVSIARACTKLRPVLHGDPDRVKFPRLAALRLEAENVLAMHLFADQLNGLLQSVLLQEIHSSPAGGLGEQAGKIRLVQPHQFADRIH